MPVSVTETKRPILGRELQDILSNLDSPFRITLIIFLTVSAGAILMIGSLCLMVAPSVPLQTTILISVVCVLLFALCGSIIWRHGHGLSLKVRDTVTALSHIKEELSHSNAEADRLRDLLVDAVSSVDEGFVLFDSSQTLVVCNDRYRQAYPTIADLLVPGASFSDILEAAAIRTGALDNEVPEHRKQWIAARLFRHLKSSSPAECQLADGRWYRISERQTRAGGIVKILSDITSAKLHQQELANKTDVLESTFEAMIQGLAVFDRHGRLATWNNNLVSVMGYPDSLLRVGTPLTAFEDHDRNRGVKKWPLSTMEPDRTTQDTNGEWRLLLPDTIHVDLSITPMPRGGKVITFADTTARRKTEAALQQAQKMDAIGQLAGGIAHEFNNMLTSIGGFSRMALRCPEDADRVVMCLNEVTRASDRAASLTSQLLNFSRRSADEEMHPVRLKDMLKEISNFLRPLLSERIDVLVSIDAPDLLVSADPTHLHQAIVNLCINARDAMPEGGSISLSLSRLERAGSLAQRHPHLQADAYACLTVKDTGTGIDPAHMDRIFEPFFTTKEQGKGTGLGLPMVYSTVEHLRGTIEVSSIVGQGSTFTLYLPILADKPRQDSLPAGGLSTDSGYGLTILLAEDEDSVRRFITMTLEEADCTVLTATDGSEAKAIFDDAEDVIDVLISDVIMPTMDGPTLARTVLERRPDMKVILISGYSATEDWKPLIDGPRRAFLAKPVDPSLLLSTVKAVTTPQESL